MATIFRQLLDAPSSTYTYLLADERTRDAILIDPVFEQVNREVALVKELDLRLVATIETHVHADHVTGAWLLRQRLGSKIVVPALGGASGADIEVRHGDRIAFGNRYLETRATPGHTNGCTSYVLDDKSVAFTGDALLIRGCGRTDLQQGDAATLFRSVHEQIFSLPDGCRLYPAHDYKGATMTTVHEELLYNPRLARGVAERDFVGYMKNMGLGHPKQIDIAVPANLRCGEPAADGPTGTEPTWAPLTYTYAGVWEASPQWLEEHLSDVQVVDVREKDEYEGSLGHIDGARLIPLADLKRRASELSKAKPVIAVCRSGARSAQAVQILEQTGFAKVANLAGGMIRWRGQRLPTFGGGADI
ncbi:MAG: MBL fold metallo-hydrolase [Alphaproteobacteria bacterium]|nr:MBL fold metallo-hydrolase [Alphaproteobacteria bacterium]